MTSPEKAGEITLYLASIFFKIIWVNLSLLPLLGSSRNASLPLREKRCVTTLIMAAKETRSNCHYGEKYSCP